MKLIPLVEQMVGVIEEQFAGNQDGMYFILDGLSNKQLDQVRDFLMSFSDAYEEEIVE